VTVSRNMIHRIILMISRIRGIGGLLMKSREGFNAGAVRHMDLKVV
jgi:hypothetical protein